MWYLLAFVCGGLFGMMVMALCVAAKRGDQGMEEMMRRLREVESRPPGVGDPAARARTPVQVEAGRV